MSQQNVSLLSLPLLLSATVAANRFVTAAGAQVAANGNSFGAARFGGVSGERITADVIGTAIVESGAAIAANATLGSDATGRAVPWASGGKLAVALQAASTAGQMIEVLLLPNA